MMHHIPPIAAGTKPFTTPARGQTWAGKRLMDIVVSLILLPLLLPFIALLWGLARRDGGPGFFRHKRVGRDGRMFDCLKIRTMVPQAEHALADHLATHRDAAAQWARCNKLSPDPRVTPLGRILRRVSLDELPQIFNVLRGEMSLVGPRPVTRPEMPRYGPYARHYMALRPGITGLWQVSTQRGADFTKRIQLDMRYCAESSLWLDLRILARTAKVIWQGTGQ